MTDQIALDKIRGDFPEGQRGAFEELVSQLARRGAPDPSSFRRIEGAGGDGGIECIHDHPGGGTVGYQAKYHINSGDIDWNAIDRSVKTALAIHADPRHVQQWKQGFPIMSGPSKKSSVSSKQSTPEVDDADVQKLVDVLLRDKGFARSPSPDVAHKLALDRQKVARMTSGYAEEFARKVRLRLLWVKPSD